MRVHSVQSRGNLVLGDHIQHGGTKLCPGSWAGKATSALSTSDQSAEEERARGSARTPHEERALRTPHTTENARVSRLVYTGKTVPVYIHVMQHINILHYEY